LTKDATAGLRGRVLDVKPISRFGTKSRIIRDLFGGKDPYRQAIPDLEQELYRAKSSSRNHLRFLLYR